MTETKLKEWGPTSGILRAHQIVMILTSDPSEVSPKEFINPAVIIQSYVSIKAELLI